MTISSGLSTTTAMEAHKSFLHLHDPSERLYTATLLEASDSELKDRVGQERYGGKTVSYSAGRGPEPTAYIKDPFCGWRDNEIQLEETRLRKRNKRERTYPSRNEGGGGGGEEETRGLSGQLASRRNWNGVSAGAAGGPSSHATFGRSRTGLSTIHSGTPTGGHHRVSSQERTRARSGVLTGLSSQHSFRREGNEVVTGLSNQQTAAHVRTAVLTEGPSTQTTSDHVKTGSLAGQFIFKHHEDPSQYAVQYRHYHTVGNTGGRLEQQRQSKHDTDDKDDSDCDSVQSRPASQIQEACVSPGLKLPEIAACSVSVVSTSVTLAAATTTATTATTAKSTGAELLTVVGVPLASHQTLQAACFSNMTSEDDAEFKKRLTSRPATPKSTLSSAPSKPSVSLSTTQDNQFCRLRERNTEKPGCVVEGKHIFNKNRNHTIGSVKDNPEFCVRGQHVADAQNHKQTIENQNAVDGECEDTMQNNLGKAVKCEKKRPEDCANDAEARHCHDALKGHKGNEECQEKSKLNNEKTGQQRSTQSLLKTKSTDIDKKQKPTDHAGVKKGKSDDLRKNLQLQKLLDLRAQVYIKGQNVESKQLPKSSSKGPKGKAPVKTKELKRQQEVEHSDDEETSEDEEQSLSEETSEDEEEKRRLERWKLAQRWAAHRRLRAAARCPFDRSITFGALTIRRRQEETPSPSEKLVQQTEDHRKAACRVLLRDSASEVLPCSLAAGDGWTRLNPWPSCSSHQQQNRFPLPPQSTAEKPGSYLSFQQYRTKEAQNNEGKKQPFRNSQLPLHETNGLPRKAGIPFIEKKPSTKLKHGQWTDGEAGTHRVMDYASNAATRLRDGALPKERKADSVHSVPRLYQRTESSFACQLSRMLSLNRQVSSPSSTRPSLGPILRHKDTRWAFQNVSQSSRVSGPSHKGNEQTATIDPVSDTANLTLGQELKKSVKPASTSICGHACAPDAAAAETKEIPRQNPVTCGERTKQLTDDDKTPSAHASHTRQSFEAVNNRLSDSKDLCFPNSALKCKDSLHKTPKPLNTKQKGSVWRLVCEKLPGQDKTEYRLRRVDLPIKTNLEPEAEDEHGRSEQDNCENSNFCLPQNSKTVDGSAEPALSEIRTDHSQKQHSNLSNSDFQNSATSTCHDVSTDAVKTDGGKRKKQSVMKKDKETTKTLSDIFRSLRAKGCLVNNCKTCNGKLHTDVGIRPSSEEQSSPRSAKEQRGQKESPRSLNSGKGTRKPNKSRTSESHHLSATSATQTRVCKNKKDVSPEKRHAKESLTDSAYAARQRASSCSSGYQETWFETDPKKIQNEISLTLQRTRTTRSEQGKPMEMSPNTEQRAEIGELMGSLGMYMTSEKNLNANGTTEDNLRHDEADNGKLRENRKPTDYEYALPLKMNGEKEVYNSGAGNVFLKMKECGKPYGEDFREISQPPTPSPVLSSSATSMTETDSNVNSNINSPGVVSPNDAPAPPNSPVCPKRNFRRFSMRSKASLESIRPVKKCVNRVYGEKRLCDIRERRTGSAVPLRMAMVQLQGSNFSTINTLPQVNAPLNWATAARAVLLRRVHMPSEKLSASPSFAQSKRELHLRLHSFGRGKAGNTTSTTPVTNSTVPPLPQPQSNRELHLRLRHRPRPVAAKRPVNRVDLTCPFFVCNSAGVQAMGDSTANNSGLSSCALSYRQETPRSKINSGAGKLFPAADRSKQRYALCSVRLMGTNKPPASLGNIVSPDTKKLETPPNISSKLLPKRSCQGPINTLVQNSGTSKIVRTSANSLNTREDKSKSCSLVWHKGSLRHAGEEVFIDIVQAVNRQRSDEHAWDNKSSEGSELNDTSNLEHEDYNSLCHGEENPECHPVSCQMDSSANCSSLWHEGVLRRDGEYMILDIFQPSDQQNSDQPVLDDLFSVRSHEHDGKSHSSCQCQSDEESYQLIWVDEFGADTTTRDDEGDSCAKAYQWENDENVWNAEEDNRKKAASAQSSSSNQHVDEQENAEEWLKRRVNSPEEKATTDDRSSTNRFDQADVENNDDDLSEDRDKPHLSKRARCVGSRVPLYDKDKLGKGGGDVTGHGETASSTQIRQKSSSFCKRELTKEISGCMVSNGRAVHRQNTLPSLRRESCHHHHHLESLVKDKTHGDISHKVCHGDIPRQQNLLTSTSGPANKKRGDSNLPGGDKNKNEATLTCREVTRTKLVLSTKKRGDSNLPGGDKNKTCAKHNRKLGGCVTCTARNENNSGCQHQKLDVSKEAGKGTKDNTLSCSSSLSVKSSDADKTKRTKRKDISLKASSTDLQLNFSVLRTGFVHSWLDTVHHRCSGPTAAAARRSRETAEQKPSQTSFQGAS